MKKVKSVTKAWKKLAAVFLSIILTVGLVSGALPLEVFAADDKIIIIEELTLDGYAGVEIPEGLIFGGHTVHKVGSATEEIPLPADCMSIVKTGDVIIWRVEVEPEETLQQICLNIQNQNPGSGVTEYCWSRGVTVDNPVPQTQRFQDTLNQVRLMDVDRLYKEIYISEGWTFRSIGQSMGAPSTMQEKHAFLNWRTAEGDFSLDTTSTEPLTLYASYAHPLIDTWTPQADDAFHWVECTCGEKANMEVHIEGEGKVIKPPTDTDPGEKTYECMKCHHVRTEVIRSTINYSIIMNGYSDGGALPDTADIALWLWQSGGNTGEQPDKKVSLIQTRIEGNKFFYSCDIQDLDTYEAAYIVDGSGFRFPLVDAFLKDGVYEKEFSYYRFRFMNGNEIWNEQYLFSSTWLREPAQPMKENRVFVGWAASDGSIVNLSDLKNAAVTERTTLYAVWEHPADDEWEWKASGDNHWRECNCGDKEEGHTAKWNEGVITKEPTDTEDGEKVYTCEICGMMKKVKLSITGNETEEDGSGSDGSGSDGAGSGSDGSGSDGAGSGSDGSGSDGSGSDGAGSGSDGSGSDGSGSDGSGSDGSGSDGAGSGSDGSGSDGAGSGSDGSGSDGAGSGSDGSGSGSDGSGSDGDGSGSDGSDGAGSGSDGSGSDGSGSDGSGSDGDGSGSDGSGSDGSGSDGDGSGSDGSGSDGSGSDGSGSDGDGSGSDGSGSDGDGSGSDGSGSDGDGSGSDGSGSDGSGSDGDGSGSDGSGSDGDGSGSDGSGSDGDGSGSDGDGSGSDGDGSGSDGSGSDGDGSGSDGDGSGSDGTGSGNGGAGSGSDGNGSGNGGAGSGTGGTGNGSSGAGTGTGGNGSGIGTGAGNGTGDVGDGAGSGTGDGTADAADTEESEGMDADGAANTDRGSSGAAHESNRGTGSSGAVYMSTGTAGSGDEAVNSGRRTGKDEEPETGDITHVEIYATIAMIAGLSYLFSYFRDEKHGITEEEKKEIVAKLTGWAKRGGYFRRKLALVAIFLLLVYYHSIGKQVSMPSSLAEEIS